MQLERLYLWMGTLVAASLIALLFIPLDYRDIWFEVEAAYFYSMFLTHPTLASVWAGLGPAPFRMRLLISVIWLFGTAFFCVLCVSRHSPTSAEAVVPIVAVIVLQWLMLQPLFLILTRVFGFRIRPTKTGELAHSESQTQFGIRHLLVLMSGIALLSVIGRALQPYFDVDVLIFFALFGFVNMISQIPLVLALLSHRYAITSALVAVVFIVIVTAIEYPILDALKEIDVGDSALTLVISTNTFSAALAATAALIVRLHGFLLLGVVQPKAELSLNNESIRSATSE